METKYDIIVNFLLNNWFLSVVALICVVLMAVPQVRDGLKTLYKLVQNVFKQRKNDIYIYEKNGEKVTMTRVLKNKKLDLVMIDTTSHDLGIQSEYAWLKEYYPDSHYPIQYLSIIQTEQGEKVFDHFPITKEKLSKEIYFDISSFFEEPLEILMDEDEYISRKIKEIYRKKNNEK